MGSTKRDLLGFLKIKMKTLDLYAHKNFKIYPFFSLFTFFVHVMCNFIYSCYWKVGLLGPTTQEFLGSLVLELGVSSGPLGPCCLGFSVPAV